MKVALIISFLTLIVSTIYLVQYKQVNLELNINNNDLIENGKNVIITPTNISQKQDICIIFLQGALIEAQYYKVPLLKIVSNLQNKYNVWIGIPQFTESLVNPLNIQSKVEEVQQELYSKGMPQQGVKYFLAGHSLGGAQVVDYALSNPIFSGSMLWGATFSNSSRPNIKIPTLQLGGELDGLTPIMKMALSYYFQVQNPLPDQPATNFPVVVIEGMNHIQFTTDKPNAWIKKMDLKASITSSSAHDQIGQINAYFIDQVITQQQSQLLQIKVTQTGTLLDPLIRSLLLETSYQIKPPCYENPITQYCWQGSAWTSNYSQNIMSGFSLKPAHTSLIDVDGFHEVYQTNPVHLPKVLNKCVDPEGCVLNMQTVTQAIYSKTEDYTSASELRTKMTSRQRSYIYAGYVDANFSVTDAPQLCAEINNASINWALANAGQKATERYLQYGELYEVGPDLGPYNAGPEWIWRPLQYNKAGTPEQPRIIINSPMMKTPNKYIVPQAAGFHYCKILSPARVMEWMHTQGLRALMGIDT